MDNTNRQNIFTEEEIKNFAGLFYSLKKVHDRLVKEGYQITNGQIILPKNNKSP